MYCHFIKNESQPLNRNHFGIISEYGRENLSSNHQRLAQRAQ
jgi:hypothetical protein